MARAQPKEDIQPQSEAVTETVTYTPGPMDPPVVKWCGQTFQANVPKEITGDPDGSEADKLKFHLIESAKNNKHFTVGSGRARARPRDELPKTAEAYRAYAVGWINDPAIQHTDQLIARFAKDRELQASCEVGSDDFAYLGTLFMPRLHELARADELQEPQVAAIWINHGVNQLPW